MPRIAHSVAKRKRHKKVLKAAKGFWGDRSTQFQQARRALMHAMVYAYRDRKNRKREFRALWIARINAACRKEGLTYSRFMSGLKKAKIEIDRKMLSNLAINDVKAFEKLIELVKNKNSK